MDVRERFISKSLMQRVKDMAMSILEKNEIRERIEGMSDEEKILAIKCLPMNMLQDEINRRNDAAKNKLDMIYVALAKSPNKDLQDIVNTLNELRNILDIGNKHECW